MSVILFKNNAASTNLLFYNGIIIFNNAFIYLNQLYLSVPI